VDILLKLTTRYPWLPSFEKYHSDLASKNPSEFISEAFLKYSRENLQERILIFFKAAFDNLEEISDYRSDDMNVYLYLILKILSYIFNDKVITNRIANLYSKITNTELNKENDYNLYYICHDLDIDLLFDQKPTIYRINVLKDEREILKTNFRIHYTDYLKLATNLRDDYRKLIHNPVSKGYVFIKKRNIIRLLQENVRQKFLFDGNENVTAIENFKKQLFNVETFKELYDKILLEWKDKKEDFEYSFDIGFKEGLDISSNFPPCAKEILSKAREGQNLQHTERLIIVFFLHALNYPVDKITNIFSTLPDFDRDKTTYQVNFAKNKGYTPYSCASIKSLNLCMASKYKDKLCLEGYFSKKFNTQKKISHPLFYVQLNQFRTSKKDKNIKNSNQKGK